MERLVWRSECEILPGFTGQKIESQLPSQFAWLQGVVSFPKVGCKVDNMPRLEWAHSARCTYLTAVQTQKRSDCQIGLLYTEAIFLEHFLTAPIGGSEFKAPDVISQGGNFEALFHAIYLYDTPMIPCHMKLSKNIACSLADS